MIMFKGVFQNIVSCVVGTKNLFVWKAWYCQNLSKYILKVCE